MKRVDFYAGGQLVGFRYRGPFTATWSNVQPGTYSLTAKATDDKDAKTTSAAISVSVAAAAPPPPPPTPTTIVFVPGADYATNATSVTVELRRRS